MVSPSRRFTAATLIIASAVLSVSSQAQATPLQAGDQTPPGVTSATPPAAVGGLPAGVTEARMANGAALSACTTKIHALSSPDAAGHVALPGLVTMTVDVDGRAMQVYWHKLTTEAAAQLSAIAEANDVRIAFIEAAYPLADRKASVDRLLAAADRLKREGITLDQLTAAPHDGGMPQVTVVVPDRRGRSEEAIKTELEEVAQGPLDVTVLDKSSVTLLDLATTR